MNIISRRRLFVINLIFAAPIVIAIVSELIFALVIIPLNYINNGIGDILGFPSIYAYYFLPYIGWGAIVPITTLLVSLKSLLKIMFGRIGN